MGKRIIIEMDVDYWTPEVRKGVMQFLIHNCKVTVEDEDGEHSDFKGLIIEPKSPYPLIPVAMEDEQFDIEW